MKEIIIKKIEYQCEKCASRRILFFPNVLQYRRSFGYYEYVDVHECSDNTHRANVLFVDDHFTVRSQVLLEAIEKETKSLFEASPTNFSIPVPKKTDLVHMSISPNRDFTGENLKSLIIEDKLRNCIFKMEEQNEEEGDKINVSSPLGFLRAKIAYNTTLDQTIVSRWITTLLSKLEKSVLLSEDMLNFIFEYLDQRINHEITEENQKEIEILINGSYAFAFIKDETYFPNPEWEGIIEELTINYRRFYRQIMNSIIEKKYWTILELYIAICEKLCDDEFYLPEFIEALAKITLSGFITIEKLQFVSV